MAIFHSYVSHCRGANRSQVVTWGVAADAVQQRLRGAVVALQATEGAFTALTTRGEVGLAEPWGDPLWCHQT